MGTGEEAREETRPTADIYRHITFLTVHPEISCKEYINIYIYKTKNNEAMNRHIYYAMLMIGVTVLAIYEYFIHPLLKKRESWN